MLFYVLNLCVRTKKIPWLGLECLPTNPSARPPVCMPAILDIWVCVCVCSSFLTCLMLINKLAIFMLNCGKQSDPFDWAINSSRITVITESSSSVLFFFLFLLPPLPRIQAGWAHIAFIVSNWMQKQAKLISAFNRQLHSTRLNSARFDSVSNRIDRMISLKNTLVYREYFLIKYFFPSFSPFFITSTNSNYKYFEQLTFHEIARQPMQD